MARYKKNLIFNRQMMKIFYENAPLLSAAFVIVLKGEATQP